MSLLRPEGEKNQLNEVVSTYTVPLEKPKVDNSMYQSNEVPIFDANPALSQENYAFTPTLEVPYSTPVSNTKEPVNNIDGSPMIEGNLRSVINTIRDVVEQIEAHNFRVDTDELDLENEYQIIIKIEK